MDLDDGGTTNGAARKRFLTEHADEAAAIADKEKVRRERKAAKEGAGEAEDGLVSAGPEEDSC